MYYEKICHSLLSKKDVFMFSYFFSLIAEDKDLHNKRVPKIVITTLSSLCGAAFLYIG